VIPTISPAPTKKARLGAFVSAVCVSIVAGLCLYSLVSFRRIRLETGMSPPMRNGRPAGIFVGKDRGQTIKMNKHPEYRVIFTNVSGQTLFRCYPSVSILLEDPSRGSMAFDPADIEAGKSHEWLVSGPDDGQGKEYPLRIDALCNYYDAFGFKHVIDKDVEKENVFRHL
jgi:hypothetical protein